MGQPKECKEHPVYSHSKAFSLKQLNFESFLLFFGNQANQGKKQNELIEPYFHRINAYASKNI